MNPPTFMNPPTYAPTGRKQLRDEAADYIRELIISGQAQPDTKLPLATLAEEVNASITPIREALLLLVQDGWIIQEPNRGFRVAPIARRDVEDAYLIHGYASGELAARAAETASDETIAALREVESQIQNADGRDHEHVEALNYRLHGIIYAAAESPRLLWFVVAAGRFVPRRFWATIPGWLELNWEGHAPIIDALERNDDQAARRLMCGHIKQAGELLLAHLDATSFWRPEES